MIYFNIYIALVFHQVHVEAEKFSLLLGFPGGSVVKNLPANEETWVRFLGGEDPLEEVMAAQSSILAWRISWTEETDRLESTGLQRVKQHD